MPFKTKPDFIHFPIFNMIILGYVLPHNFILSDHPAILTIVREKISQ